MKRSELFFTFILVPIDILGIIAGFIAAYYVRSRIDPFNIIYIPTLKEYLVFIYYFLPLWLLVFALAGLYNTNNTRKSMLEFHKILIAVPTALMLFVTVIFFIKESFFSRLIILYGLFAIAASITLLRMLVLSVQRYLFRYGIGVKRILIVGTNDTSKEIASIIEQAPQRGFKLIGFITTDTRKTNEIQVVGLIKDIGSLVSKTTIDEIFQTDPDLSNEENMNLIHLCEDKHVAFRFVPNLFTLYTKNNSSDTFGKVPVFEIKRSSLDGWGRIAKRIIDIVGALVGIIITLPLQIPVAIIIKFTSSGSIFFKQERVGRDKNFRFMKFRSMYQDAEKKHAELIKKHGNMFKLKDDPRVTKIGKFLRKTSLDEIPQFYNFLRGDMSLVGPRPPMPVEVARYTREEKKRLGGVKPGITGLWQVSGRSDISFDEWVKLDAYYIENWSLMLDFVILIKTIWVVLFKRGAY